MASAAMRATGKAAAVALLLFLVLLEPAASSGVGARAYIRGALRGRRRASEGKCTATVQTSCAWWDVTQAGDLPQCGPHADGSKVDAAFVVIGDYGDTSSLCESQVAVLVEKAEKQFGKGKLDFAFTTGDNAYWNGNCESLAANPGTSYSQFFTPGACVDPVDDGGSLLERVGQRARPWVNSESSARLLPPSQLPSPKQPVFNGSTRFWPTLGNHDWDTYEGFGDQLPYLQFFNYLADLGDGNVGNGGQYYRVRPVEDIELFSINSNLRESEASDSQKDWLKRSLNDSNARFKFVFFHHAPYCTAEHDKLADWMDLPYASFGATAVFNGHEHVYERIQQNGITYIVNGLGGHPWLYDISHCSPTAGSVARYDGGHGFLLGLLSSTASGPILDFCFYSMSSATVSLFDHFPLTPS